MLRLCPSLRPFCVIVGFTAALSSLGEAPRADPQQSLRVTLLDHQVYLRDFDAARTIAWHWDGSDVVPDAPPALLTLAAFLPSHVEIKHDVVVIEGARRPLLRDGDQLTLGPNAIPVKLIIQVPHSKHSAVIPRLPQLLFFSSQEEAVAALPSLYRGLLPERLQTSPPKTLKKCDCADRGKPACEGKDASVGLTAPRLLSQVAPEFSEEARRNKFSGDVGIVFTVDLAGHPRDLWLGKAAGLGLDEQGAAAARQYVFRPGTCHGQPMPIPLPIDINFQIF